MPRYTAENTDVRTIPAGEIWVGIIAAPKPYIALAARPAGDTGAMVTRFGSAEALAMADELIRLAARLEAPNN